jgi:hypothetical protein
MGSFYLAVSYGLYIKAGLCHGFHYQFRNNVFAFHGQDFIGVVGIHVPLIYAGLGVEERGNGTQAVGAVDAGFEL